MVEAGVKDCIFDPWFGILVRAGTPKPIIEQLNKALNQVLADKEIERRIEEHGADVETSTPEKFGELVKSELAKWKGVVQRAKLTAD
jgi:tripartite-type tricarboxylate transporter receptor subunit TctC